MRSLARKRSSFFSSHSAKANIPLNFVTRSLSVFLVRMHDDFGVAFGRKAVALLQEVLFQLAVIVDFAVVRDPYRAVFVAERLLAVDEIDHGETAMSKADEAVEVDAAIVRPAMRQLRIHAGQHPSRYWPVLAHIEYSANPTHL